MEPEFKVIGRLYDAYEAGDVFAFVAVPSEDWVEMKARAQEHVRETGQPVTLVREETIALA